MECQQWQDDVDQDDWKYDGRHKPRIDLGRDILGTQSVSWKGWLKSNIKKEGSKRKEDNKRKEDSKRKEDKTTREKKTTRGKKTIRGNKTTRGNLRRQEAKVKKKEENTFKAN